MIPFKSFNYIFTTYVFCSIVYGIVPTIIIECLYWLNTLLNKNSFSIPVMILSILCTCFIIMYVMKQILNHVVLGKYKKIQITTELKEISYEFTFKVFVPCVLFEIGVSIIYMGICYLMFGKYGNIADTLSIIPSIVTSYFVLNWILKDYIKVEYIGNNTIENSDEEVI